VDCWGYKPVVAYLKKTMEKPKDITTYKISADSGQAETILDKSYTVQVIQPEKGDSGFFDNPVLTSLVFPVLVTILTFLVARLVTSKKDKKDFQKVEAEIEQIKTSFQPIVLNSLQNVQNEIFKDKTSSLKGLIKSKSELFNVEQIYHEGDAIIEDSYDYYQNVYLNFSNTSLSEVKKNSLDNASLFPNHIRIEFQKLLTQIFEINDIQEREFSTQNQNMPTGVETKLETISKSFDRLIDMIRKDLHLDNTFIHDFISEYQKIKKK